MVLAYHSLEDRIVKRSFAELALDRTPPDLPVALAAAGPQIRLLSRGAEPATEAEIAANPAGRLGAAASRRANPGGGMTRAPAARGRSRLRRRTGPAGCAGCRCRCCWG